MVDICSRILFVGCICQPISYLRGEKVIYFKKIEIVRNYGQSPILSISWFFQPFRVHTSGRENELASINTWKCLCGAPTCMYVLCSTKSFAFNVYPRISMRSVCVFESPIVLSTFRVFLHHLRSSELNAQTRLLSAFLPVSLR